MEGIEHNGQGSTQAKSLVDGYSDFLTAFPVYHNGIDAARLSLDRSELQGFLSSLLNQRQCRLPLTGTSEVASTLLHLFVEHKNTLKNNSLWALKLGFPMLLQQQGQNLHLSPLFLWPLRLEREFQPQEQWTLLNGENHLPEINPLLSVIIGEQSTAKLLDLLDSYLRAPSLERFKQLLHKWCVQAQATLLNLEELQALPELIDIELDSSSSTVLPAGLLADYRHPQGFDRHIDKDYWKGREFIPTHWQVWYPFRQDPCQASAFRDALQRSTTLIYGKPGTGKEDLIYNLVATALLNQKKVLLLSARAGALNVLQQRIQRMASRNISYLLRTAASDIPLFLQLLRAEASRERYGASNTSLFHKILERYIDQQEDLDAAYRSTKRQVFGQANWISTVGHFLESDRFLGKEMLGIELPITSFSFEETEYHYLANALQRGEPLYRRLGTLRHPLRSLRGNIFLSLDKTEALDFVSRQLDKAMQRFTDLQQRYTTLLYEYAEALRDHYDRHYRALQRGIQEVQQLLKRGQQDFGKDFIRTSSLSVRLYGGLSQQVKQMRELRQELFNDYAGLTNAFRQKQYVEWPSEVPAEEKKIARIPGHLQRLEEALEEWYVQLPTQLEQHIRRLNANTVHPALPWEERIAAAEQDMDQSIENLNQSGLYELPLQHNMLTLQKRQQFLEQVLDQLENSRLNLRDFDAFFDWQQFWLQQEEKAQNLITAIVRTKINNWNAAFDSWYLNQLLQLKQTAALPEEQFPLQALEDKHQQLQQEFASYLDSIWEEKAQAQRKTLREQLRMDIPPDRAVSAFQELLKRFPESITDVIPVLLCTPQVANLLPLEPQQPPFDLLVVDEAQYVPAHMGRRLSASAKQVVVLGDDQYIYEDGKNDLLEELQANEVPDSTLRNYQQYIPGNPWQLASPEIIRDTAKATQPVRIIPLAGTFDERQEVNVQEVDRILELLGEIPKTPARTYPSVGIITLTEAQRNAITLRVEQLKTPDHPEAELVRQLERNGLQVLHINELEGMRFDLMLLSLTYAATNGRTALPDRIAQLNRREGIRQLYELMAVPRKQIWLLHSWQAAQFDHLTTVSGQGLQLLAAYLELLQGLALDDPLQQREALRRLPISQQDEATEEEQFYDQVRHYLLEHLDDNRLIRNAKVGVMNVPLLVLGGSESESNFALYADGFVANSPFTDYSWELAQRRELRELGYKFLPLYTKLWWKAAEQEAQRIATLITG